MVSAGNVRVVDQHGHVEGRAASGGAGADAAEADDQHGLAGEFGGHVGVAVLPARVADLAVEAGAALGERHDEVDRVFGDAGGVGGAGDHQRDFAGGERGDLDGVVADADAGDDLHGGGGVHFGAAVRGAAEGDGGCV